MDKQASQVGLSEPAHLELTSTQWEASMENPLNGIQLAAHPSGYLTTDAVNVLGVCNITDAVAWL